MPMPPEIKALAIGLGIAAVIAILLLVFGDRPELAAAIRRRIAGRTPIMSSDDGQSSGAGQSANQSVDQSAPTSLRAQTSGAPPRGLATSADRAAPDMDAENTGLDMPRVSPYLTDTEFIVFLASQKLRNGKYRMSANDIVKAAHGDRTDVLAIVRQLREPAAVFPPLSDEQAALREQLQLDRH